MGLSPTVHDENSMIFPVCSEGIMTWRTDGINWRRKYMAFSLPLIMIMRLFEGKEGRFLQQLDKELDKEVVQMQENTTSN